MAKAKTTFKYHLKRGSKVLWRGITNNLERKQAAYQAKYLGVRIVQVGRRTTREAALRWEREGGKRRYEWQKTKTATVAPEPCGCQMCERHQNEPDDTPQDR